MTGSEELLLLLLLVLLAASMAGAFARLLRLPAVPVQVLFGLLLAHGPSAVVDLRAAALLQPAAALALLVVAATVGLRLSAPVRAFPPERPPVLAHLLAEVTLVPLLVWLALVFGAGVPGQVALVVGLMALGSVAEPLQALARRAGAPPVTETLMAVARADLAASLALAMGAVFALRLRFDPPGAVHGIELPLAACCLALGASLGRSAPGLAARFAPHATRASNFALGVCGTLAGATILPPLLGHALLAASLAVLARLAGKWAAAAWTSRRQAVVRHAGLALAPGGLTGVALILVVRHEPSLAGFADMFLAVGVWIATLNATLGPLVARAVLRADVSAAALPDAPRRTPPAR